jgi:DNA-binding transcriptional regulator YhcF (GntR family)
VSSPARLVIDAASFVPLTEQIRRGIRSQVANGLLGLGDRLPTVRQLARDLDLAAGTVAKAYQQLEADGVIQTRGRRGSFIATRPGTGTGTASESGDPLGEAARRYLAEALRLGVTPQAAEAAVTALARRAGGVVAGGAP